MVHAIPEKQEFTWQQVAEHNTAKSAWVIVRDDVYDVTEWIDRHPGGREILLLAIGRDVTDLMTSYHPFTDKADKMLAMYKIGTLTGPREFPQYSPDRGFYKTVCERVDKYFKETAQDPKSPWAGLWRMAIVFSLAALSFCVMHGALLPGVMMPIRLLAAVVYGICQALPLLHVMHDASHTAIGHNETWWKVMGRLPMDWFAGACMISWHHQHTIGHHLYTNVHGVDPDLPVSLKGDPRRLVHKQEWTSIYKFQHVYLPVLYGVLGLKFRVQDITGTFLARTNGPIRVNFYDSAFVRILLVKLTFVAWRIVLPLMFMDASAFWTLFIVAELMTGYWLAFNFQVSHVSTIADYPNGDSNSTELEEWAVSQVKTSVDYSHGNWLTTFLAGALNYQTVHHLLPCVSQYHYPAIAPIVMDVCKEYGIKYRHVPTFAEAFTLHWRHLYDMGKQGKAVHMD